tara:strand:+ start:262 stop:447 length:186 start_codon:yes stop_codon:yes gene_type:complete
MKKPQINLEEALKDFDKVLKLVENIDLSDISKLDFRFIKSQAEKYSVELKEKYGNDLDTKK